MTLTLLDSLVHEFGWSADIVDTCWLDCAEGGHLKRHLEKNCTEREIVLCLKHAWFLESGVYLEDYSGAPLPSGSRASQWPWRSAGQVNFGGS